MKELTVREVKNLVAFKCEETTILISKFLPERTLEVVDQLNEYSNIQLEFLQSMASKGDFN